MSFGKRAVAIVGAALFALMGSLVSAQPAAAEPTCPYPYVCFYNTDELNHPDIEITGMFQQVTTDWQWLSGAWGSDYVVNTRNDDVAYLHMTDGTVRCVEDNSAYSFVNDEPLRYVDAIRISWSSSC